MTKVARTNTRTLTRQELAVIIRTFDPRRAALAALVVFTPGLAAQSRRPVTIDDLMRIRTVTEARISPDGSKVAYVVSVPDVAQNQHDTDIWLVSSDGGEPLRLTSSPKMDQAPRWSPDGKTIAFLSAREGPPNVYLLSLGGGEPRKLTTTTTGVADFAWSPDGGRIAFISPDPASEADQQAEKDNGGVMVIDEKYPLGRLRVIDVATKAVTDLTQPDRHVSGLAWSPDGNRIAFVSAPTPKVLDGDKSDLFTVPSHGGAIAPLVVQPGPEDSPIWSPDGRTIAFISSSGSSGLGNDHLFVIAADGGTPRKIAPAFDNHFGSISWSHDGKDLYFTSTDRVRDQVFKASVDGGTVAPVTSGDRVYTNYSLSKDGTRMAVIVQDPTTPPEVYVTPTASFQPKRLSRTNPVVDSLALGTTEVVRWKAKDGKEIEGLLLKPVGYQAGQRVPVLTYIHGGPSGVFTLGFGPQLGSAPLPLQAEPYPLHVFAGKGYAVFMPNIRGSSGYGRAFLRSNIKDWGHADFQDVMSGLDYLIAQGIADGDRLGMMGWSYGGYMTSWSITQTDRFKAASVGAGLPDLVSLHGATDIPSALASEYFGSPPWKAKELYENSSAIFFAQNIKTPTLIQHGEKDDRVQLSQAWELYRALEANDVPRLFVVYPRQGHLILEPKLERDMLQRNLSWFTKWVGEKPKA